MKIVWLAPEPPVPPLTGGRERSQRMLAYLARRHTVQLITFATPEEEPGLMELHRELARLTIVPYPSRREPLSSQMSRVVAEAIGGRPDAVHVQGLEMYRYVPQNADVRYVLDLHDVPGLLEARLIAVKAAPLARIWSQLKLAAVNRRETEAICQASAVIVVSEQDRKALRSAHVAQDNKIVVIPNGVDLDYWALSEVDPDPATVLFPGALNWPPNIDAAIMLIHAVLPYVRARVPQVQVIIAGYQPDPALRALAQADAPFTLIANPPDMRPIFARAMVVAVPLRAATGTRYKIVQAMAMGRPVVSTPIGAEGLDLEKDVHLLIAPLVEPFSEALVHLLTHPARRAELVRSGQTIIQRHAWDNYLPVLDSLYPAAA